MTREEAIEYFKRHIDLYCVEGICREAEKIAIKVLEQEPCEDAVSREAVEDIVMWYDGQGEMLDEIQKLPSVQPKQRQENG